MKHIGSVTAALRCSIGIFLLIGACGDVPAAEVLVSSRNTHSVKRYDFVTGAFLGDFVQPGSGGLSFPQEVLLHSDGSLLVTGRGQTAVKRYHRETGAYLGNFTTGYPLDNPTKTTRGPDGLLYVSQWGTTQNKVARFDAESGAFVDEFTSIGITNGTGHAWDPDGNLLVGQYGSGANGRVLKFDPDGALLGTFIPPGPVRGPVNLWFDEQGRLVVVDWTLGDVLRFNGVTGAFDSVLVSTVSNLEGATYDTAGNLYLCDWTGNQVLRLASEGGPVTPYITAGGLMAPNSILIRDPAAASVPSELGMGSLLVYPNPASERVHIDYSLPVSAHVFVEVRNAQGQTVATLRKDVLEAGTYTDTWDGRTNSGRSARSGVYFISSRIDGRTTVRKIVLR